MATAQLETVMAEDPGEAAPEAQGVDIDDDNEGDGLHEDGDNAARLEPKQRQYQRAAAQV